MRFIGLLLTKHCLVEYWFVGAGNHINLFRQKTLRIQNLNDFMTINRQTNKNQPLTKKLGDASLTLRSINFCFTIVLQLSGRRNSSHQKFSQTMDVEVINENLMLDIYGFSGIAVNKDYVGTAFKLMDKMWQIVKSNNLKNKGLNIWVYEQNEKVFAGVELNDIPEHGIGLEQKSITLTKYAYYKHVGSYNLIKQVGQNMSDELK